LAHKFKVSLIEHNDGQTHIEAEIFFDSKDYNNSEEETLKAARGYVTDYNKNHSHKLESPDLYMTAENPIVVEK
jgi:hypothetical protein